MYRTAKIEQVQNGYIVSEQTGLTGDQKVYNTFEEVMERLRFFFDVKVKEGKN